MTGRHVDREHPGNGTVAASIGGETEIVATMNAEGVKPMWDSGVGGALAGETTLDEVARTINPPAR